MTTRDVKVTVTNAEEAGKVTLSQPRPRVGLAITASYTDPDGGLASATWQWWRTRATDPGDRAPVPQRRYKSRGSGVGDWLMIADATSATYTPVDDDDDDTAPLKSGRG